MLLADPIISKEDDYMTTDLTTLGAPQLVSEYNRMVGLAGQMGLEGFTPVKRFKDRETALRRCRNLANKLEEQVEPNTEPATHPAGAKPADDKKAAAAPKDKTAAAPKAADPNKPPTIHALTEAFNELVPEAIKAGVTGAWVKHHTSDFASRDGALKMTDKLKEAIAEAKKPKPAADAKKAAAD
jgi:hypothetical protein